MSRDPWASYWSQDNRPAQGCLPSAETGIGAQLAELWQDFARTLKPGEKLVDLATGDGAVLKNIVSARVRIDLVGVDSAPMLPKAKGFKLLPSVRMEALPFAAETIDAVTSQFGVEYGDVAAIAGEIRRVLRPGGRIRFVVHHRSSRIVAHNAGRRRALHWARAESGIPEKARRLADSRRHVTLPTPLFFHNAVGDAASRFPEQPVAAEYLAAILQALSVRPEECLARLDWLDRHSADEIGRIDALLAAARDAEGVVAIQSMLTDAEIEAGRPTALPGPDRMPFGWLIEGIRKEL